MTSLKTIDIIVLKRSVVGIVQRLSIIVPCYNEEECIEIFYKEIKKVIKKMNTTTFL